MKSKDTKRPIIVVKKVSGHGGHHGGSWKVAYADFVTAMMAFFMVMWIMGMDPQTKDSIQGYFNNPVGFKKSFSGGSNPLSSGNAPANVALKRLAMLTQDFQRERFEEARERLRKEMSDKPELRGLAGQVEILITSEGLRIELLERGAGETLFAFGSGEPKPLTRELLLTIAATLTELPNEIVLEGHTDAVPFAAGKGYTNWELSVDRANAARRVLIDGGVSGGRVTEVRGYADKQLRLPSDPTHPSNRRVSILLPFVESKIFELQGMGRGQVAGEGMEDWELAN
jgi:chemotaxis protein MotB